MIEYLIVLLFISICMIIIPATIFIAKELPQLRNKITVEAWNRSSVMFKEMNVICEKGVYNYYQQILFPMCLRKEYDFISNEIRQNHHWYDCDVLMYLWTSHTKLDPNGVYVDIGANIGACSLLMLSKGIKTIAFEPMPLNLNLFTTSLLFNQSLSDNIELYPIALGSYRNKSTIYVDPINWGGSSLVNIPDAKDRNEFEVSIYPFTDVWKKRDEIINLMKIDVEGFEFYVLQGIEPYLANHQIKIVYMEISCEDNKEKGLTSDDFYYIFDKYGYSIRDRRICKGSEQFNIVAVLPEIANENDL